MKFNSFFKLISMFSVLTLILSACGAQATTNVQPTVATSSVKNSSSIVSATGEVVPAQWTTLSFGQAGSVIDLLVKEGDVVKAGDVLAQLAAPDLRANLMQKQAAIKAAEANLALVKAGPRAEDVVAAQQSVLAAQAKVAKAIANRDRLSSGVTQADIIAAQNQVYVTQIQVDKLQKAMDKIIDNEFAGAAGEPVSNQLKFAEASRAAAQAYLDDLQNGPDKDQLRIANAQIWLAQSQQSAAQAQLDLLKAGAQKEDVAIAQVKVDQAKADAAGAQAQLDQAQIVAPFDGTIAKVSIDANQFVGPGQPIVQLAALAGLQIETTDLNEIEVARVAIGNSVAVRFEALPNVNVTGSITRIAPKVKEGTGVNYTTVIKLDQIPDGLRWGMTAFADIDTGAAASSAPTSNGAAKVSANGKAIPAQKAALSFSLPGQLAQLKVDVGSAVKKGDVIAQLDAAQFESAVAQAEAGLALAKANLDKVKAGPRAEQILQAQGNLSATNAALAQAAANRDFVQGGPTVAQIDSARAEAQRTYNAMVDARTYRDLLQQAHDDGKDGIETVNDANKLYNIAYQTWQAAQAKLDKLLEGADKDTLRAAQAQVGAASAQFKATQAQVDALIAGATLEQIAVAEAAVVQAQAAVDQAKALHDQATLLAPFDGTIADVPVRESQFVNAGMPIVVLGDLAKLHIETTDLNEKDISSVSIGGKVSVTFDALPGQSIEGTVTQIAPKSIESSGVNYTVTIDLTQIPDRLRWGMTALVGIGN
jgi:multidrug efflux pump subunit AcrA (membrane-fusion protein)